MVSQGGYRQPGLHAPPFETGPDHVFAGDAWKVAKCKASWEREFKIPWCEAGPPNHLDDKQDSDQ